MATLVRALTPPQACQSPLAGIPALLLPPADELLATSPPLAVAPYISAYPRLAEIERAANAAAMRLLPYELPLLAELSVNLLRRIVDVCGAVENFIMGSGWSEASDQAAMASLAFYLQAVNDFLGLVKTILLEVSLLIFCLLFLPTFLPFSAFYLKRA